MHSIYKYIYIVTERKREKKREKERERERGAEDIYAFWKKKERKYLC